MRPPSALLIALLATACTSAPRPRPDADAAVALLRPTATTGAEPIASELLELAWEPERTDDDLHEVGLLHTGTDALVARVHLIRAARESVDIQTFAWSQDDAGQFLIRECLAAAERGVQVRILVDQMRVASHSLTGVGLAHANLNVRLYNPVSSKNAISTTTMINEAGADFYRVNQRMHNKVIVIDGRVAIVGGRNVGEDYFDMDPEFDYIDRDAIVIGPVARAALESFDSYWNWENTVPVHWMDDVAKDVLDIRASVEAGGPGLSLPAASDLSRYDWADQRASLAARAEVLVHTQFHSGVEVSFHADPPGKLLPDGTPAQLGTDPNSDESLVRSAEKYVVAQSNYLVFTESAIRALRALKLEKPYLPIIYVTNSSAATGNDLVYGVSRKQRHRILTNGMAVLEMKPVPGIVRHLCPRYDVLVEEDRALKIAARRAKDKSYEDLTGPDAGVGPRFAIHAKAMVIDGKTVLVGSHNYDPRSDELNTEAGVLIQDEDVAAEMEDELRLLLAPANSWVSALKPRIPVLTDINEQFIGISRALPIFDLWPIRGYTDYQLHEGAEPLLPDDPQFYENYDYAGEFPEVDQAQKVWKTRFYSWFGGMITGLL